MIASTPLLKTELAEKLPGLIRFGTSTWTYPGWKGLVYHQNYSSERVFRQNSLKEYAACPLFRTVGVDSFFYSPPAPEKLAAYAELVPLSFKWVTKVWEQITVPRFPTHPRYGEQRGKLNPYFLNSSIFIDEVLDPFIRSKVQHLTGPFIFQFPTINPAVLQPGTFFSRLSSFFSELPPEFQFAVEIRNGEFLCNEYFQLLNQYRIAHCFNHWNYMPSLQEQMKKAAAAGGLKANFFIARILTPQRTSYSEAVQRFEPYDSIKYVDTEMRQDVIRLVRRALSLQRSTYVLVNNRSEGNAPRTIEALHQLICDSLETNPISI